LFLYSKGVPVDSPAQTHNPPHQGCVLETAALKGLNGCIIHLDGGHDVVFQQHALVEGE